jgi:hypothetical protein
VRLIGRREGRDRQPASPHIVRDVAATSSRAAYSAGQQYRDDASCEAHPGNLLQISIAAILIVIALTTAVVIAVTFVLPVLDLSFALFLARRDSVIISVHL